MSRAGAGRSVDRLAGRSPCTEPELYAGAVFRAELAKLKIKVDGSTMVGATPASQPRTGWPGTARCTLADLLIPFMKLSNNMHAEALTKTMGRVNGGSGSWTAGLAVTTGYLRRGSTCRWPACRSPTAPV